MVHCTGGGQVKCRNFGNGIHYIKDNLFDVPPLFCAISENGDISQKEMYQVFNMGHRLEMYCSEKTAGELIGIAAKYGVDAKIVGYTEKSGSTLNAVTIKADGKIYEF